MTVILLRHGRSTANTAHVLAGRSAGVELDAHGRGQAAAIAGRLAGLEVAEIVRSPLLRCEQTVAPLAQTLGLVPVIEERIIEVDYGQWTGRALRELVSEPLWATVQRQPSAAVFPGGESLAAVSTRAVCAIREHDARLAAIAGKDVLWLACSHGDVIKSVIADAAGMHLDAFQRIMVDPASLSVIRYTENRPMVMRLNDTGDLGSLATAVPVAVPGAGTAAAASTAAGADLAGDAVVGGGAGAPVAGDGAAAANVAATNSTT